MAALIALAKGEAKTAVECAEAAGSVNTLTLLELEARAQAYRGVGDRQGALRTAEQTRRSTVPGRWLSRIEQGE